MILDIKENLRHFIKDEKTVTEIFNAILRYAEECKANVESERVVNLVNENITLQRLLKNRDEEIKEYERKINTIKDLLDALKKQTK